MARGDRHRDAATDCGEPAGLASKTTGDWDLAETPIGKPPILDATLSASVQDDIDEVVIKNRTHPLYGRTFRVHHRVTRPDLEPSVIAFLAAERLIRIPVSALSEALEPPTKLTLSSMTELVVIFEVAARSCPSAKVPSGPPSQTP